MVAENGSAVKISFLSYLFIIGKWHLEAILMYLMQGGIIPFLIQIVMVPFWYHFKTKFEVRMKYICMFYNWPWVYINRVYIYRRYYSQSCCIMLQSPRILPSTDVTQNLWSPHPLPSPINTVQNWNIYIYIHLWVTNNR